MNLVKRIPHTHAQMQTRDSRSYQGESLGLPIPGEYKWYAVREPKFCYYRKIQMACRQGAHSAAHICLEEEGLCVLPVTPSMRSGYHVIHSYYVIK